MADLLRFTFLLLCIILAIPSSVFAQCQDMDSDGFGRPGSATCPAGAQQDCNDQDTAVYPGAPELCDGFDNDCDGDLDNNISCNRTLSGAGRVGADTTLAEVYELDEYTELPTLAWTRNGYGVHWSQNHFDGLSGLMLQKVDLLGDATGDPLASVINDGRPRYADMVWSGSEYATVWTDMRSGTRGIWFARFDASGIKIGSDVPISDGVQDTRRPVVVWNGNSYGVVWFDSLAGTAHFCPVSSSGEAGSDIDLGFTGVSSVELAWDGARFGIAFARTDNGGATLNYRFVQVDPDGLQVGTPQLIDTITAGGLQEVSLTWTGSEYGYWWGSSSNIYFARLDSEGVPLGDHVNVTTGETWASWLNGATWTGEEYGLLYRPNIFWPETDYNLRFSRVSAAGVMLGNAIILSANPRGTEDANGDMVWTGADFGVVWHEANSGIEDVYLARIGIDVDNDEYTLGRDCDDTSSDIWAVPGETTDLMFAADRETITWATPEFPGTILPLQFDTMRSTDPADFDVSASCVESDDGPNTTALDQDVPQSSTGYYYLVRAQNSCPNGEGTLGTRSGGMDRIGRTCP